MCHSVWYCKVNWTEYWGERGSTTGNAKLDMHTYIYVCIYAYNIHTCKYAYIYAYSKCILSYISTYIQYNYNT